MNQRHTGVAVLCAFVLVAASFPADLQAARRAAPVGTIVFSAGGPETPIFAFSGGLTNTISPPGGGGGAGKANFQPVNVVRGLDAESTKLFKDAASGRIFPKITIKLLDERTKNVLATIELEDASISSYQIASSEDGGPIESISLEATRIRIIIAGSVSCWDVALNKAC